MSDAMGVVSRFLETASDGPEGFEKAVRGWFTPQTVWENVGLATTTGPEQALGLLASMGARGIASLRIETKVAAAAGDKVLTERIDYMVGADGKDVMALPVMGIFELDGNGKIARWADYFDASAFKS